MFVIILKALGLLIAFGAILFLVVITTKFVGGKANKAMRGRYINIVETISLGIDKQLHLVRVGEQFLLIASSGKNVEFLSNVRLDDYKIEEASENNALFDFKDLFDKYLQNFNRKKVNESDIKTGNEEIKGTLEGDNFRNNLNRLKNINTGTPKQGKQNEGG